MPNSSVSKGNYYKLKRILIWFFSGSIIVASGLGFLLTSNQPTDDLFIRLDEFAYFIEEGDSTLVTFEASPQLGSFNYVSYDSDVVQFIENRLIAVSPGNATIMVSSQSNPSVFQTVSVIVRTRDVEPEAPVDPDDSDDEDVITPPTIYTITITNETGVVITTFEVEEGSSITTSSLDLPENFKGFFLEGETCEDDPFDLETPITENLTLIEASYNEEAACLQLDYIVLSGRPVAGTELTVEIFPIGTNVTISWYTSVNNRTYREIPGENESTYTVRPEDSGKFIRVYVVSDSNPPMVKYDTLKLDVFGTVSDNGGSSSECTVFTTINNTSAFIDMTPNGCYKLTADIDLSGLGTLTQSALDFVFTGTFDGDDYTILGLGISASSNNLGLFYKLGSGAIVQNLTLSGFNITGTGNLGLLAGSIDSSVGVSLISINTTGSHISGESNVGGLIGEIKNSTAIQMSQLTLNGQLKNSSSNSFHFGGVVGNIENAQVSMEEVLQLGNIEATGNHIGGIVGLIRTSSVVTLSSISQHGNVIGSGSGTTDTGGLIGQVRNSSSVNIQNALNTGSVSITINDRESGGLIGRVGDGGNFGKVVITNAYNAGTVSSNGGNVGSLIGKIENANSVVTFTAVFWNTDIDSVSNSIGDTSTGAVTSGSITGVTNDAMIDIDTFNTGGAEWDINSYPDLEGIWTIGGTDDQDTYPWLSWTEAPDESVKIDLIAILIAEEGYIPIASIIDLQRIQTTQSTATKFAVGTPHEVQRTTTGLSDRYLLVNNIVLNSTLDKALIDGIFEGTFDGNSFTLSNATLTGFTGGNVTYGVLFNSLGNATVKNLNVENFNIFSDTATYSVGFAYHSRFGIIAGRVLSGKSVELSNIEIIDSHIELDLFNNGGGTGEIHAGILIGRIKHPTTSNPATNINLMDLLITRSSINVKSNSQQVIGFVYGGSNATSGDRFINITSSNINVFGNIENSSTNSQNNQVGGFAGWTYGPFKINLNDSTINVNISSSGTQANYIGGLIGSTRRETNISLVGVIVNSELRVFSQVLNNTNYIGGLIGYIVDINITGSGIIRSGLISAPTENSSRAGHLIGFAADGTSKIVNLVVNLISDNNIRINGGSPTNQYTITDSNNIKSYPTETVVSITKN